ncbi:superoxide dismutase [Sorangium cellulosum]|uniref:Superoxide dismutase n=1 Tax=Sorangium cellulosum TaxID=56 RepID=A0A150QNM2_SORCE|nr:superoxide dismutase [Sorangium cellulosum]KYF69605.1 superoxide dismutase [Sorangium cellulosum]
MNFEVAPLPYPKEALEPAMSRETLEFHYEKHHKGYMAKLKSLIEGKPEASGSLVDVVRASSGAVFNNAAQVWNHTFFWEGMRPSGGGPPPSGDVGELIAGLGGWEKFRGDFIAAGVARFGSGYAWLVLEGGKGKIVDTPNAETPLTTGAVPLLTCDVWEHAYYLDHRNNRQRFLEVFLDRLVSWDAVARNLRAAR